MRRERIGVCRYGDVAEGGGAGGSSAEGGEVGKSGVERGRREEVWAGRTRGITRRGRVERSEEALERDFPFIGISIGTSRVAIVLRRRFC